MQCTAGLAAACKQATVTLSNEMAEWSRSRPQVCGSVTTCVGGVSWAQTRISRSVPRRQWCYSHKKELARQHPGTNTNSNQQCEQKANWQRQCSDNEPNHITPNPNRRSNPVGWQPCSQPNLSQSSGATRKSGRYTGTRLHAPGHQQPSHQVPATAVPRMGWCMAHQ